MKRSFTIASRFDPAYSLLGRWIRARMSDRRAADSTYIVAAVSLGTVLLISQYLTWAYLQPLSSVGVQQFFAAQASIAALFAAAALIGRRPATAIELTPEGLFARQGGRVAFAYYAEMLQVSVISAQTFHAHYARYAATQSFVGRAVGCLLLIETDQGPIVLGVDRDIRILLEDLLAERISAPYPSPRVGAA